MFEEKVLFVDDEPNILGAYQRVLRGTVRLEVAQGGEEGLRRMAAEGPFALVIADMRMPGMDGVELLSEVRKRHPQTVRIALSGQASRDTTVRAIGVVHQYLAKPCDAEALKSTLSRICALGDLATGEPLRRMLSEMASVPSLPPLHDQLARQLQSPDASIHDLARTVAQDVGMSARILQLVGSAFFADPTRAARPDEAAVFLGIDVVRQVASSAFGFSKLSPEGSDCLSAEQVWQHSLTVARAAEAIAHGEHVDEQTAANAFAAGLLHDVGKVALAAASPEQYACALADAAEAGIAATEAELRTFGATHAAAGAFLMGVWGLPEPVVQAIALHHSPADGDAAAFGPATAVRGANALLHQLDPGDESPPDAQIDLAWLADSHLAERLPAWRQACCAAIHKETVHV